MAKIRDLFRKSKGYGGRIGEAEDNDGKDDDLARHAGFLLAGQDDDQDNPDPGNSRYFSIIIDRTRGLTEAQLRRIVERAREQGWTRLYVFGPGGKMPHPQLAAQIQGMIEKMGLGDQMQCCGGGQEYAQAGGHMKGIMRQCREQGGQKRFNSTICWPVLFNV